MIKVRKVNTNDFEKCIELLKDKKLKCANGDYFKLEWLYDYLDDELFFVAEDDNSLIGLVFGETIKPDGALIWMIAVDDKRRNQGIGSLLLKEFESNCLKKDRTWIMVYVTDEKNTVEFYKKNCYHLGLKCIEAGKDLQFNNK